jgi:hypothetical protein
MPDKNGYFKIVFPGFIDTKSGEYYDMSNKLISAPLYVKHIKDISELNKDEQKYVLERFEKMENAIDKAEYALFEWKQVNPRIK